MTAMTIDPTIAVGIIAATTALTGYLISNAATRRAERARRYAEALDVVERYRQLPYTFYRLHDGTPETRTRLAEMLGETQKSLSFHRRWLTLESAEIGAAYDNLVDKVRERNSEFRKDALSRPVPATDVDIEAGYIYLFDDRAERLACIRLMRKNLALLRNLL
ncbi:hypothetical protein Vqi01_27730 [Micromonospora qiuiae]|uniref:Uncharacterized protein n=1 Tax=Micromonospora qiuiae TaxID=502268 RepID=A0ABQ4JBR1_9ACTN|nr:hypothetical protein [Micromonospora qiuiae]GIJ27611.1 hypothetical protein Vqi01_27730 [Micromonospora qiuiae]